MMHFYQISSAVLFVAVVMTNAQRQATHNCPTDWQVFHSGKQSACIWLSTEMASWINAVSWCRMMDAHLVEIGSRNFNNLLTGMIQGTPGSKYWIGLSSVQRGQRGNFIGRKWMNIKRSPRFENFKLGQSPPDKMKNCVYVDEKGLWYDDACKNEFQFICQK